MNPGLDFLLVFAWSALGFGLLSASMERHTKQIFDVKTQNEGMRYLWSVLGWLMLVLALLPAIHGYGLSVGVAVWVGFLALSATLIALLLTYRPRALRPTFYATFGGSAALVLLGFWTAAGVPA
ncbi:MAG: DUF3325 domain-containing protein [Zoogloeaceae bacterium]|jgi:hypothetical protein|nr:DUF3325 domain-containing protein [Zoogloeaceae bacterium]